VNKVLVTGGAGFIGSHLVKLLLEQDFEVVILDDFSSGRYENIQHFSTQSSLSIIEASILDVDSVDRAVEGVDWVFHLAGKADIVPSINNPKLYYDTNVTGTFNVLQSAHKHKVKRFIYAASASCYGIPDFYPTPESASIKPLYPYALTKFLGEELVLHWSQVYKLPALSLRLSNVYGPRSRTTGAYGAVFGVFLVQKLKGIPFTVVGNGRQTRDFTFVTDVAKAFLLAAKSDLNNSVFNVGSGCHYSINHLVSLLGGDVVYIPKRPQEPDCTFADISAIKKALKWEAEVDFEAGVNIMLNHISDWSSAPLWTTETIEKATADWFKYLSNNSGQTL
jgi:UDP-glucose 4-epimerase